MAWTKLKMKLVVSFCSGVVLSSILSKFGSHLSESSIGNKARVIILSTYYQTSEQCIRKSKAYDDSFKLTLPETQTGQSLFSVSSLYRMNFATGRNVCTRPDHSKHMFLYSEDLPAIIEESGFLADRSCFRFSWQFEVVKGKIPSTATRVPDTTTIISPAYAHHVTHFAESIIPLWHAMTHPDVYPVHASADWIFLKQSRFSDLEWNRSILTFLAYHASNVTIVDSIAFGPSTLICFDTAGMVGMGLHEFGFFANEGEAQSFKTQIIRFYSVSVQNHSSLLHQSRCH